MLPTIDISLIGVLLAVWHVVVIIWDRVSSVFNWITQKALALALGSKFWATAFFLAGSFTLISLFSTLVNYVMGLLGQMIYSSISFSGLRQGFDFLNLVIPLDEVSYTLSFLGSAFLFYQTAKNYAMWYIKIYGMFLALRRSFKV